MNFKRVGEKERNTSTRKILTYKPIGLLYAKIIGILNQIIANSAITILLSVSDQFTYRLLNCLNFSFPMLMHAFFITIQTSCFFVFWPVWEFEKNFKNYQISFTFIETVELPLFFSTSNQHRREGYLTVCDCCSFLS